MILSKCAAAPCKSCPYRRDVPSGVWHETEYKKLPNYDGEIIDQAMAGATQLFNCHQRTGELCAGWIACHGTDNLLALRFHAHEVDPSVWSYESPVPVFTSGQEACDHGCRDIAQPGASAQRTIHRLIKKQGETMPTVIRPPAPARTHCKHGHEMTEANTIQMKAGGVFNGKIQCRKCKQIQSKPSNARHAAKRKADRQAARDEKAAKSGGGLAAQV